MANRDTMQQEYMRLLKVDGHLGALYDPEHDVVRVVCRAGTIDYNLADLRNKHARRQAQVQERTG